MMKKLIILTLIVAMAGCTKDGGYNVANEEVFVETTMAIDNSEYPPFAVITVKTELNYSYDAKINRWYTEVSSTQTGELYDELSIDMIRVVYDNGKVYLMLADWEVSNIDKYGPYDYLSVLSPKLESFDEFGGDQPYIHSFDDSIPEFDDAEYAWIEDFKFTATDGSTGSSLDFIINSNEPSIKVNYSNYRTYRVSFDNNPYYLR